MAANQVVKIGSGSVSASDVAPRSVKLSAFLSEAYAAEGATKITLSGSANTACDRESDSAGKPN